VVMDTNGLIHRVDWTPAALCEEPLSFRKVVFLIGDDEPNDSLSAYQKQLADEGYMTEVVSDPMEIAPLLTLDTIIVHIPYAAKTKNDVYDTATKSCIGLIEAAKMLQQQRQFDKSKNYKLFSLIHKDLGIRDLGYAPLYGLARVIKMEIPEIFGGLFEEDRIRFPLFAIKYAQGFDIVRVCEDVVQTASLQPFQDASNDRKKLQLNSEGTYLITGGTGGMGLEIATWMSMRGARNILLVSRRGLPSDLNSKAKDADIDKLVSRITELEALGTTVHVLAIDLSKPDADSTLSQAIDNLHIPPIKGVVHAAGIVGYNTIDHCPSLEIANVLAPKVVGALNLDKLFSPGTLDFFILTSSIGQLVGSHGQISYAPGNAFLDALATQRRCHGDNSTSIQWTAWRDVGMMARSKSTTRSINRALHTRGVTDICKEEAFAAWDRIASLNTDHAAVVRVLELEAGEPLRHPILKNITPRKEKKEKSTTTSYNKYPEHAVAVVGMACRTAAGDTMEDLWEAIQTGRTTEREIDLKRFPEAARKDKMWGSFLSNIDSFDHQFFKKSKREASALDPHQRVLLETTYHALESASCFGGDQQQEPETSDRTKNKDTTGCFIGMTSPDYCLNLSCHPLSPYTGLGMSRSYVAGRLSHYFGWTGPSQTIDTSCSSSMVAIHQACRAIQLGECTRAVAGGTNLVTNLVLFEAMRLGGFLSETGGCKTFDARADGYCRGEAVGIVVLKSLDKALKDGDNIQGVLLATSNNQSMNTTSITNPVLESQAALYRDVLARAGVSPGDVSYVEAHGTGTRVGDPIEIEGIRQVLGGKNRRSTLHVGSLKSNIGHSEGASGVVSLIKVLLMMKHGKIPMQAQFKTLNPNIPVLETDGMAISKSQKEWRDDLRLALVNNFGASGSNAAAVVAPPPPQSFSSSSLSIEQTIPTTSVSAWPIFISAASRSSLLTYCNRLKDQIQKSSLASELSPNLAFTLATRQNRQLQHVYCTTATSRQYFPNFLSSGAQSLTSFINAVNDLQRQLSDPEKHTIVSQKPKPIVLLFGGQNGNTIPSAKPFYDVSLLFRRHLHQCDEVMQSLGLPSLFPAVLQGIQGDSDLIFSHAAFFAIQYSCGMSWIDSGVKPQAICGHSFGEWTALTISGAMKLKDGLKLVTGYAFILILDLPWNSYLIVVPNANRS
jgi:3-oxoacyl-(acyl-carrier-protein) synthase/NAD(P)-dependent dehydrogenase (short-subunit alcohol dehydrogenase family)